MTTNQIIIAVLSLIILTVLVFNRTSVYQFGGAEGPSLPELEAPPQAPPQAPLAPPPQAPVSLPPVQAPEAAPAKQVKAWTPEVFKFKIGARNFAVSPFGGPYRQSHLIYYDDGTVREVSPNANYTYSDTKNGDKKVYSVFSLTNAKSVNPVRLNDNITYFMMFPQDLAIKNSLKKLNVPELNRMIEQIETNTRFGLNGNVKPVKVVKVGSSTAVLFDNLFDAPKDLYVVKKGESWDKIKRQAIDTSEYGNDGSSRAEFLEQKKREIKSKVKYNCATDVGAQDFLSDLAFYPGLTGCPYESWG